MSFWEQYSNTRALSVKICSALEKEDYVVQPVVDVSPPKWHLGHTTWFFETFILKPYSIAYQEYNPSFNYVFNSYYETLGARVIRTDRGNLSRPTVDEVYRYRYYVDLAMQHFLTTGDLEESVKAIFILGINHEQQHQELLWYDIKYILGHNPLFPVYQLEAIEDGLVVEKAISDWVEVSEGLYEIGYKGTDFHFDNELSPHQVYLQKAEISTTLVTNAEYLQFIEEGGYRNFNYWHADGWDWVNTNKIVAPLYWYSIAYSWHVYGLSGLKPLNPDAAVAHISFYEAAAFAQWKGMRLPTEYEWEVASKKFNFGQLWEWTESAYLPYPGFSKAPGALGEYNGKFMANQMVLRGASVATSPNHSRTTYRNFFHPHLRWMFSGIRLAK
ncbi:ergothioneine biosynthesis protein EgtB [Pedobacter sp. CG_S7]|uniref:ergothioneine biosynthesis protein EgtB n=1 Tax=Pedobacter sp. CG_S7 TaxID=3143930 RepID=UPI00339111BC